jgi:hypothetical protein
MNYSTLLRRYAGWGLALGVMVACGTQDNTPPSSYGYPENLDAGGTPVVNNAPPPATSSTAGGSGGDMTSSGSSSGDQSGSSSGTTSSSSGGGSGVCPSSCKANTDCAPCGLPAGSTGKNCCVMGICAMMASCPVIRDSGRDGS